MHQILLQLGLGTRPVGSLQRSPDPLAVLRGLLLRGRREGECLGPTPTLIRT